MHLEDLWIGKGKVFRTLPHPQSDFTLCTIIVEEYVSAL
jgi:hypothetical protein